MNTQRPALMAIDDDPGILELVEGLAGRLNFSVVCHNEARGALEQVSSLRPHVVLVDVELPDVNGLEVLRAIREIDGECAVVLMAGQAGVAPAIEAVRLGALDYLIKPLDLQRLAGLLTNVQNGLERREAALRIDADVARQFEYQGLIGRSVPMQELFDSIRRLAPHARTVLITGETGTGKELVARAFHRAGVRRDRRFATVNCSAVGTLFENELFEHAGGGTLFLDEVGELPLSLQPGLLRAVECGEVQRVGALEPRRLDAQVVAATNCDIRAEAAAGRFRSDLFDRLSTMAIHLPPLRERREDIPLLTAAFLRESCAKLNRQVSGISTAAERALRQAPWEGNVRELRHVVERACLLSDSNRLGERDIRAAMNASGVRRQASPAAAPAPDEPGVDLRDGPTLLSTAQRTQIDRVLKQARGNKTEAARLLGISRRSLYRWIERLDLPAARRTS